MRIEDFQLSSSRQLVELWRKSFEQGVEITDPNPIEGQQAYFDVHAAAMRSFDRATCKWSIWWLDGRNPRQLDTPVVGGFAGDTGVFYADDSLRGALIKVRFIWNANPGGHPTWEQAFSPDAGATWETNWTMEFSRIET